ncbi:hypothetical protein ACFWJY_41145 [Streptomyces anulatus]|uniref:hypothetical protein n=1 Tax=Streptomyces anulatus TaxID=1892 RepID=UPI00366A0470
MARFNFRTHRSRSAGSVPTSPVATTGALAPNHQGGTGHVRDARSELFLLAVANFVAQDTFYEGGDQRDDRFAALVRRLALEEPRGSPGGGPRGGRQGGYRTPTPVVRAD